MTVASESLKRGQSKSVVLLFCFIQIRLCDITSLQKKPFKWKLKKIIKKERKKKIKESDLLRNEDKFDCDNELSSIICDHSAKLLFNDLAVGLFAISALDYLKLINIQQFASCKARILRKLKNCQVNSSPVWPEGR